MTALQGLIMGTEAASTFRSSVSVKVRVLGLLIFQCWHLRFTDQAISALTFPQTLLPGTNPARRTTGRFLPPTAVPDAERQTSSYRAQYLECHERCRASVTIIAVFDITGWTLTGVLRCRRIPEKRSRSLRINVFHLHVLPGGGEVWGD